MVGIPCLGLNGGPAFKHSEAFSFQIATDDQAETDRLVERDRRQRRPGKRSAAGARTAGAVRGRSRRARSPRRWPTGPRGSQARLRRDDDDGEDRRRGDRGGAARLAQQFEAAQVLGGRVRRSKLFHPRSPADAAAPAGPGGDQPEHGQPIVIAQGATVVAPARRAPRVRHGSRRAGASRSVAADRDTTARPSCRPGRRPHVDGHESQSNRRPAIQRARRAAGSSSTRGRRPGRSSCGGASASVRPARRGVEQAFVQRAAQWKAGRLQVVVELRNCRREMGRCLVGGARILPAPINPPSRGVVPPRGLRASGSRARWPRTARARRQGQRVGMKCDSVRSSSSRCQVPESASHPASKQRGRCPRASPAAGSCKATSWPPPGQGPPGRSARPAFRINVARRAVSRPCIGEGT